MSSEGSITRFIGAMRSGDDEAARKIWNRYSPRLAALARERLPVWLQCVVDGDDVANTAMCSVIMGLREGRFPDASRSRRPVGAPGVHHRTQGQSMRSRRRRGRSGGRDGRARRSMKTSSLRGFRLTSRGRPPSNSSD